MREQSFSIIPASAWWWKTLLPQSFLLKNEKENKLKRKVLVFLSFAGLFIELIANAIKINKGRLYWLYLSPFFLFISPWGLLPLFRFFFSKLQKVLFRFFYTFNLCEWVQLVHLWGRCDIDGLSRRSRKGGK